MGKYKNVQRDLKRRLREMNVEQCEGTIPGAIPGLFKARGRITMDHRLERDP